MGVIALLVPEVLGTGEALPPIDGVREPIQRMLDGGYSTGWTAAGGAAGWDIVKAYQRAITRRLGVQQRDASSRLQHLRGRPSRSSWSA